VKVERLGTLNFPPRRAARSTANLRLTVTIRADVAASMIELDRSSGLKLLDAAAFKIVRMATPFAVFRPTSAATTTRSSSPARGSSARATNLD